jgi:hypothetical protein
MEDGFFVEPAPQVQTDEPQFFTELYWRSRNSYRTLPSSHGAE